MAKFCPNCGAQNPAGNNFCERCGSKLAPPVPVGAGVGAVTSAPEETAPPPAAPPPLAPPPAVAAPAPAPAVTAPAAPYPPPPAGWQPPGAAPPTGARVAGAPRLSLPLIVGGIVGALLLVAVIGVVAANIFGRQSGHVVSDPPVITGPTNPNPPNNPNPPTNPNQPTTPAGGQTFDVQNLTVTAPAGWTVRSKDTFKVELTNGTGIMLFYSDRMQPVETVGQLLQDDLALEQKRHPDAKICRAPTAQAMPAGPQNGMAEVICYTAVPQGGASYPAQRVWIEAVSADGSTEFAISAIAPIDQYQKFAQDASVLSIKWKLPQ